MNVIFKYLLFSIIAIFINICSQRLIFDVSESDHVFIFAISTGTLAGFVSKYIFDKYLIFNDQSSVITEETKKLFKYSFFATGYSLSL